MKSKGRPKKKKEIETLKFTTYQDDIILFRNGLLDCLDDENVDEHTKEIVNKFLKMSIWQQNIFIVYLTNQTSHFTFKELAELLQVERNELRRVINNIKKELKLI